MFDFQFLTRHIVVIFCALFISAALNFYLYSKLKVSQCAQSKIIYSQEGKPENAIIDILQHAHKYAYFAVYTITRQDIADALIAAKLRGVDVKGISDLNQEISVPSEKYTLKKLAKYNIPVELPDKIKGLMHIKMLVTDNAYASGSFNWTYSASENNDDILESGKIESIRLNYLAIFKNMYSKYKEYMYK